jgi:hypothetical protein
MAEAEASTGESMSNEAVTGEERSPELCPTKRKEPTAEHLHPLEGGPMENAVLSDKCAGPIALAVEAFEQAIADVEVAAAADDDEDDDDRSITESEFAAFEEDERADYRRFWQEELLPRNPDWEFRDYSLVIKDVDVYDGKAAL